MKSKVFQYFIFFAILVVALISLLLTFGKSDLYSDNSLYAFRAIGWTDYLGVGQSGPINLLGKTTWWSGLSFHDHPPLVILLERISFGIFGDSNKSVQIPFLIAEVILIISLFVGVKKLKDVETGIWASAIFTLSSFALWSFNSGNLEGIQSMFITLAFINTTLYLKFDKNRNFYFGVIFISLSLLSKYTSIFLIPVFLINIYIKNDSFGNTFKYIKTNAKKYLIGIIIFLLLLSPVITYNYNLYRNFGIFDITLAEMIGAKNVFGHVLNFNFTQNILDIFKLLLTNSSLPFMLLCIFACYKLAEKSQKNMGQIEDYALINYILIILLMFGFTGGNIRWLTILLPLISIALSFLIRDLLLNNKKILPVLIFVLAIEFAYSVNSNVLKSPVGIRGLTYSEIRNESLGFNQLDQNVRQILSPLPERIEVKTNKDFGYPDCETLYKSKNIILYDGRVNWFTTWWYFEKYRIYYKQSVFSLDNSSIRNCIFPKYEIDNNLENKTDANIYLIYAIDNKVMDITKIEDDYYIKLEKLANKLDTENTSYEVVSSIDKTPVFRFYRIK